MTEVIQKALRQTGHRPSLLGKPELPEENTALPALPRRSLLFRKSVTVDAEREAHLSRVRLLTLF